MNHSYQSVKETLVERGVDLHEDYLDKALQSYGFNEFPKSGLDDRGLDRLVKRAIDISHSEEQLMKPQYKKDKLSIPKEKPLKVKSLDSQIAKEDLKKAGKNIIKVAKVITYPTIGTTFLLPTMIQKVSKYDGGGFLSWVTLSESLVATGWMYVCLSQTNPKLIPYVIATQLFTNAVSLGNEWAKSIKKRTEAKLKEEEKQKCKKEGSYNKKESGFDYPKTEKEFDNFIIKMKEEIDALEDREVKEKLYIRLNQTIETHKLINTHKN